jgi:hypothetical protein
MGSSSVGGIRTDKDPNPGRLGDRGTVWRIGTGVPPGQYLVGIQRPAQATAVPAPTFPDTIRTRKRSSSSGSNIFPTSRSRISSTSWVERAAW